MTLINQAIMNVVHMYSSILHKYMYIQILTLVVSGYFTPKKEKEKKKN